MKSLPIPEKSPANSWFSENGPYSNISNNDSINKGLSTVAVHIYFKKTICKCKQCLTTGKGNLPETCCHKGQWNSKNHSDIDNEI